ncbi:MAG TPA: hypothetical protein VFY38_08680, partial [Pseudonocardia sp.]|nr:hypothetical protein [Pseudonocardia sp.]
MARAEAAAQARAMRLRHLGLPVRDAQVRCPVVIDRAAELDRLAAAAAAVSRGGRGRRLPVRRGG